MRDWQSQSHVKWYCKYHIVFVPKYRRRAIYWNLRKRIGGILRELCQQQGRETTSLARLVLAFVTHLLTTANTESIGDFKEPLPWDLSGREAKLSLPLCFFFKRLCAGKRRVSAPRGHLVLFEAPHSKVKALGV